MLGFSFSTIFCKILATLIGSILAGVLTKIPLSAPIARAVLIVSLDFSSPIETMIISSAFPASFIRKASSTAFSSGGFIDILTFSVSTPEPSVLIRI